MYCRYCGKELPEDSNFCPNCGKKQKEIKTLSSYGKHRLLEIVEAHKKVIYCYFFWFILHLGLLFFSKPKYDYSGDFYPFSRSLGAILDGSDFAVDILFVDRYDFSEFFFYVVFLPVAVFGLVKCSPYFALFIKKVKGRYIQWCESKAKKREEKYLASRQTSVKEDSLQEDSVVVEVSSLKQQGFKDANNGNTAKCDTSKELQQQEAMTDEANTSLAEGEKVKKMPLLPRFVGSIIDKTLILIIFVVGSIAISPYGAPGRLGTYIGLLNTSLSNFEYVDKAVMNRYDTYNDEVSQYYQGMERLSNDPPHIGSTLELDMSITFTFILLNLLFYIIFESTLSASPGKRMLGGVILDSADDKIGFEKALIRGLCGGALMAGLYFLLHLQGGLTNTVVVVVFFLLLDLPVFFTKKSLLDLCTGTSYAKR